MIWVAALKPTNIGVPIFRDEVREYLEIAVLTVALRAAAKPTRLIELIHRAIPYPSCWWPRTAIPSASRWRISAGRRARRAKWSSRMCAARPRFNPIAYGGGVFVSRQSCALRPAARDLFALYQGWLDRVAALEAAQITGTFAPPDSADRASALRDGLDTHARLQRDITIFTSPGGKGKADSIAAWN